MHIEWKLHFHLEFIETRAKIPGDLFEIPGRSVFFSLLPYKIYIFLNAHCIILQSAQMK